MARVSPMGLGVQADEIINLVLVVIVIAEGVVDLGEGQMGIGIKDPVDIPVQVVLLDYMTDSDPGALNVWFSPIGARDEDNVRMLGF